MKIILTAVTLTIASAAAAQTATPANPHAGHSAGSAPAQSPNSTHAGHEMGGMMMDSTMMQEHCAKMKATGQKMGCCENMPVGKASAADPHAGHNNGQ